MSSSCRVDDLAYKIRCEIINLHDEFISKFKTRIYHRMEYEDLVPINEFMKELECKSSAYPEPIVVGERIKYLTDFHPGKVKHYGLLKDVYEEVVPAKRIFKFEISVQKEEVTNQAREKIYTIQFKKEILLKLGKDVFDKRMKEKGLNFDFESFAEKGKVSVSLGLEPLSFKKSLGVNLHFFLEGSECLYYIGSYLRVICPSDAQDLYAYEYYYDLDKALLSFIYNRICVNDNWCCYQSFGAVTNFDD